MTSADFDEIVQINLAEFADLDVTQFNAQFSEEYKKYTLKMNAVKEALRIPIENHEANLNERETQATNYVEKIIQGRDDGTAEHEDFYMEQYIIHRDSAKFSFEKCQKFQKLYYYIETQVFGELEDALVYEHLSNAGVNLMNRAVQAKNAAAKNSQIISGHVDEVNEGLKTIDRKFGLDDLDTLTEASEYFGTNYSSEEKKEEYKKEIEHRIENAKRRKGLPPTSEA